MKQGNILGEEFEQYVFNQIHVRQSLNGAGGAGNPLSRDPQILNYLNTRNAWVKMASGVALTDKIKDKNLPEGSTGMDRLESISKDLQSKTSSLDLKKYNSTGLAKNFVLFNTLSNLNFKDNYNQEFSDYTFRSGIQTTQKSWLDVGSSYGLGGTSMGLQPTPGIIDVSIDCINRGSIRKATVTLKAFNTFQFSIIEMLYLRLGYTMMLEWGWDKYTYKTKQGDLEVGEMNNTLIEELWFKNQDNNAPISQTQMISSIEEYRAKYHGNYDGFFGKVNNFTWNFNSDGSYDITINLITVGDVVESLKTNIDAPILSNIDLKNLQTITKEIVPPESSIYNSLGRDVLSQYLIGLILNRTDDNPVKVLKFSERLANITEVKDSDSGSKIKISKTPTELDYFITLGDFLDKVQELVIPTLKSSSETKEKVINIETDRKSNYITCFFNQIPFDPKVCIFTTIWTSSFTETDTNLNSPETGLPLRELDSLSYKFMKEKEGFVAGQLMNIYLNIDFLLKKISNNLDEKGDLSLYKLVESICLGLNDALGNVNNLEPVIKDDKTLVIIDQNPIPQIQKFLSNSDKSQTKTTTNLKPNLEVYGYNDGKSNFLKDIKFQTKIDNSLASMISIGATAGGSNTKNSDATSFSKWNLGLRDRFTPPIEEPSTKNLTLTGTNLEEYEKTARKYATDNIELNFEIFDGNYHHIPGNKEYIEDYVFSKNPDLWYNTKYSQETAIDLWVHKVIKQKKLKDRNTHNSQKIDQIANGTYGIVLSKIFGRSIEITYNDSTVTYLSSINIYADLFTNEDLVKKLKSSFKSYINNTANNQFENNQEPSGNIGFIPVSFDLTLEGLSGVKIYNKLNMDTRFLPPNYGKSLDFLITKVNHKISNNNWDTILGTISTSNLDKSPQNRPITESSPIINDQITRNNTPTKVENYLLNNQGLNPVKNLITSGESKGEYDVSNNGDAKYSISTQNVVSQKISYLLDITSKRSKGAANKTFAMGKYQIIPSTLEMLVSYSKDKAGENYVGRDWTFDPTNQEKLGNLLLLIKRSGTGAYLSGKNEGTKQDLERALQQIGQEWASMPCIVNKSGATVGDIEKGTGKGAYYGGTGVNPSTSHVTLKQMVIALIQSRVQYSNKQPIYKPSYF